MRAHVRRHRHLHQQRLGDQSRLHRADRHAPLRSHPAGEHPRHFRHLARLPASPEAGAESAHPDALAAARSATQVVRGALGLFALQVWDVAVHARTRGAVPRGRHRLQRAVATDDDRDRGRGVCARWRCHDEPLAQARDRGRCRSRHPQQARAQLECVPVLLAGLLKHFGQAGPAEIPSKRRFTYRFVIWRARSMGIPMRMPPAHPFNPLSALRLIIAAGGDRRAAGTVLDAVFRDGRDVSDPAVIADLAPLLGVTNPQAAIADPAVKERLRANTDWAISRGIFGVPTLVIGEELFWGHDAVDMALEYLNRPEAFADPEMRAADVLPVGVTRER